MTNAKERFESSWKNFETNLRGKMLAKLNQQEMTIGLANLLLKDASQNWFTMYHVDGKWLSDYSKEFPDKGQMITTILQNDMRFNVEVKKQAMPKYIKYAVPAAGAIIGGGIAHLAKMQVLTQVGACVIPAVVLYPIFSGMEKNSADNEKTKLMDDYIEQLNKFKISILSIIEN